MTLLGMKKVLKETRQGGPEVVRPSKLYIWWHIKARKAMNTNSPWHEKGFERNQSGGAGVAYPPNFYFSFGGISTPFIYIR